MFSAKTNTIVAPSQKVKNNGIFFQPKLTVNQPNDIYEQEADTVADRVIHKLNAVSHNQYFFTPAPVTALQRNTKEKEEEKKLQRKCAHCEEEEKLQRKNIDDKEKEDKRLHRKEMSSQPVEAGKGVNYYVNSLSLKGRPLPPEAKRFFEPRLGYDLSFVKIHDDAEAAKSAEAVNAMAYTVGNNIVFNKNQFSPGTDNGKKLLAHELVHVIQQDLSLNISKTKTAKKPNANNTQNTSTQNTIEPSSKSEHKSKPQKASSITAKTKKEIVKDGKNKKDQTPSGKNIDDKNVKEEAIPHSPASPAQDPDFQKGKKLIKHESLKQQKHHQPAELKRTETINASALPEDEQKSQDARDKNTTEIENVSEQQAAPEKRFSADSFIEEFKKLINAKSPKTEDAAKTMAKEPAAGGEITEHFSSSVAQAQSGITKPLEEKAVSDPAGGVASKVAVPIPNPKFPPKVKKIDSNLVIPKQKTDAEISTQKQIDNVDDAMAKNKLSDDQLIESREPKFIETYKTKEQAKQKAREAQTQYRVQEAGLLQDAEAKTGTTTATELHGLMNQNVKSGADVQSSQSATETQTEKRQREIKEKIDGFYNDAVTKVKNTLEEMTNQVKTDFTNSLKEKTDTFNDNLKKRISNYYGDWRIDDELFGPDPVVVNDDGTTRSLTDEENINLAFRGAKEPETINPDVYKIFVDEKNIFTNAMDVELRKIADNVEHGLTEAHNAVVKARSDIDTFKLTLSGDELAYANSLETEINLKFTQLESTIDNAKDDLLNTLADQYKDNLKAMEKSFKDINDELKKSWMDRAIEFIETVGKTIYDLVDLIVNTLVRLAKIIWQIVKHPIRFFETLVKGLMEGISDFISNIGTYLKESFITWITGAIPAGGIKLSLDGGIEGIFKLVLNILNLGPEDLRKVAEKVFGKEFMQMIDKVIDTINKGIETGAKILEPVVILFTQGPAALWVYIKEHVQEFIQSAFDRIKESVFFAFIEKGIKYIASFFVPGGGFVKIVKAIFAAFKFISENINNIRQFIDAIFDSMERAINGDTSGVKNKVVQGLKTGVVMALDFLADLLGLDEIIASVHKIIQTIRGAILSAVEYVLTKVKPYVLAIVKKIKDLYERGKQAVKSAGRKLLGWLGLRKSFTTESGEHHTLYFEGTPPDVVLMIMSVPVSYKSFVQKIAITTKDAAKKREQEMAKSSALEVAKELDKLIEKGKRTSRDEDTKDMSPEFEQKLDELANLTGVFSSRDDGQLPVSSQPEYGSLENGFATSMHIRMLTKLGPAGTKVTAENSIMNDLYLRKEKIRSYYIAGHLLNNNLHGPGFTWQNLTPLTQRANAEHLRFIEAEIKSAVNQNRAFNYEVTVIYGRQENKALLKEIGKLNNEDVKEKKQKIVRAEKFVSKELIANVREVDYTGKEITTGNFIAADMSIANDIDQSSEKNYIV